jgi:hypothetical protein
MKRQAALLVLDDGELDDLIGLLNEIGIEFAHLRGAAIPAQIAPPERVIVTTPRRAMLTKDWPRSAPYRIAVVTEDSNTLRAMLRRVGFDLLLRRPIHPVALRLVMLRALYAGEEKRREERVTVGVEVQFRSGFWKKKALLADLSQRGCRVLAEQPLAAGTRISLPLPKEISATGLTLPCKVVRVGAKPEADGRYEMGLAFENLAKDKLAEVRALLKQLSEAAGMEEARVLGLKTPQRVGGAAAATTKAPVAAAPAAVPASAAPATDPAASGKPAAKEGPRKLPGLAPQQRPKVIAVPPKGHDAPPAPAVESAAPAPSSDAAERRKQPRAAFAQRVARLDDEADSVLLGRDLSIGGMRIEYHENLQIGDLLELAIYASPREEPVVVKARVAHDAGDGLGLAFEGLSESAGARIEAMVARLPSVESLQGGETAAVGSVVSRVLSGFRREV